MPPYNFSHLGLLFLWQFSFKRFYFCLGEASVDKEFSATYPSWTGQPMTSFLALLSCSFVSCSVSSTGSFLLAPSLGCVQEPGWMRRTNRNVLHYSAPKRHCQTAGQVSGYPHLLPVFVSQWYLMRAEGASEAGQEAGSWSWGRLAHGTPWLLVPPGAKWLFLFFILPVSFLSMCENCSQKDLPIFIIREKPERDRKQRARMSIFPALKTAKVDVNITI